MRETPLTDREKTDKSVYGSCAPRVRGREVAGQSQNELLAKGGGTAMKLKTAFGSAMLLLVAALFGVVGPAFAEKVVLDLGSISKGQVKGWCDSHGGATRNYKGGGYGCENPKGCSIGCDKQGKCEGECPDQATQKKQFGSLPPQRGTGAVMKPPIGKQPVAPVQQQPSGAGGGVSTAAAPVCQCVCEYYNDRRMIEAGVLTFTPQPNNTSCTFLVIDNYFLCKDSAGKDRPGTRYTDCKLIR